MAAASNMSKYGYVEPTSNSSPLSLFDVMYQINIWLMLFGVLGNMICIGVLAQKVLLARKFNWYLLMLSLAELAFCLVIFINYFLVNFGIGGIMLYDWNVLTCYLTDYVVDIMDSFCVFITLVLSVDRLNAIVSPLGNRMFLTSCHPRLIVLGSILALMLLKSPEVFLSQRYFIANASSSSYFQSNRSGCLILDFKSFKKTSRFNAYITYCKIITPLLLNVLPALSILVINLILWHYLRRYSKRHSSSHSGISHCGSSSDMVLQQRHRHLTKTQRSHYFTIIFLGLWLLLTSTPYYVSGIYYWLTKFYAYDKQQSLELQALSSAFFNSNHCINVFIYVTFHRTFRHVLFRSVMRMFNLNPVIKINSLYFRSAIKTRGAGGASASILRKGDSTRLLSRRRALSHKGKSPSNNNQNKAIEGSPVDKPNASSGNGHSVPVVAFDLSADSALNTSQKLFLFPLFQKRKQAGGSNENKPKNEVRRLIKRRSYNSARGETSFSASLTKKGST